MESILDTVKKSLGLNSEYYPFDETIIMDINMAIGALTQIGVGPEEGFVVRDSNATWEEFIGSDKRLEMVKNYIFLKVKQLFDPSSSSSVSTAVDNQIKELEWRISIQVDPIKKEE